MFRIMAFVDLWPKYFIVFLGKTNKINLYIGETSLIRFLWCMDYESGVSIIKVLSLLRSLLFIVVVIK